MRQVENVITLFDSSINRQPSRRTYAILLKAYIQSLNLRKARLLLFEMIARGVKIDNEIIHIILRGEGEWAVSLESVDSLLDLLGSHELEFRDMTSYNLIIDAYLRRDRPDKARGVLDKVLKSDLHPDAGTFHALMRYQAMKEGSRGVRSILNAMMSSGIPPETRHLNILISRLAREQHIDMTATVKTMSSHDLVPDTATCNIVLRELLRRKFDAKSLQAHFDSMESLNIQPDAFTFTVLLNEYKRKNRRWQRAQKLLRDQRALNPEYVNQVTSNVVLHHMMSNFTKSRPFVEIVKSNEFHLQWDLRTITHLLVAYSKSGDWSKILDLYRKLDKRLVKLDRRFYRVLLRALLEGKHYSESNQVAYSLYASDDILDQLFGRECKIRISYAILRDTRRGGNNVATDIDNFLKYSDRKGVMITEKHCNLIAVAFLCTNRAELAIELLESRYNARGRFQDIDHCELGMSAWTILMRAYARKGRDGVQGLRSCVSRALLKGSQPPTRTFLNFLRHLGVNKKLRAANPTDCDFFLQTYNECVERSRKRRRIPRPRGRQYLTKSSILMWVNRVDAKELKEKLGKRSTVRGKR
jgi:pentatricopeptide repeat protein